MLHVHDHTYACLCVICFSKEIFLDSCLDFLLGTRNSEDCRSLISNKNLYRQKGTILQAIVESKNPDTFCVCIDNEVLGHHLIQECLKKELENDHQFFHKICRTPLVNLGEMAIEIDGNLLDKVDNHGMTPLMT